jgi:hypothetical protein
MCNGAPVTYETHSPHLRIPDTSRDLESPVLMLTANACLVLGYMWLESMSDSFRPGSVASALRTVIIPVFVAIALFGLARSGGRRRSSRTLLLSALTAIIEIGACWAADATGRTVLALIAGVGALTLASVSIVAVIAREAGRSRLHQRAGRRERLSGLEPRGDHLRAAVDLRVRPATQRVVDDRESAEEVTDRLASHSHSGVVRI